MFVKSTLTCLFGLRLLFTLAVPVTDERPLFTPRGDGVFALGEFFGEMDPSTFNMKDFCSPLSTEMELLKEMSPLFFRKRDFRTSTPRSVFLEERPATTLGLLVLSQSDMGLGCLSGRALAQERPGVSFLGLVADRLRRVGAADLN